MSESVSLHFSVKNDSLLRLDNTYIARTGIRQKLERQEKECSKGNNSSNPINRLCCDSLLQV